MLMNSGQTITSLNQQSEQYLLACAVGCGEEGGGESEHGGWRSGEGGSFTPITWFT